VSGLVRRVRSAGRIAALGAGVAVLLAAAAGVAQAAEVALARSQDLRFGTFVLTGQGAVTVPPSGLADYAGAVALGGTAAASARFQITGDPGAAVEVQLPTTPVAAIFPGGQASLDAFTLEPEYASGFADLGGGRFRLQLAADGTNTFRVGGTLTLGGSTGAVSADFPVSATYAP
jgi:hypothetical protein